MRRTLLCSALLGMAALAGCRHEEIRESPPQVIAAPQPAAVDRPVIIEREKPTVIERERVIDRGNTFVERMPDGTIIERRPDGTMIERRPDGTTIERPR
jgi:hypothetical protein